MIKNRIFGKKFKKVTSLCLVSGLLISSPVSGGANVNAKMAKDTTKPKLSYEYHVGGEDTYYSQDWLVITATDNVEVETVETNGSYLPTGYDYSSKKKKVCAVKFDRYAKSMDITVTDSAGNTKKVTVDKKERDFSVATKKIYREITPATNIMYLLDGKLLKVKNGKIKVSSTKKGLHTMTKMGLNGTETTLYYVDRTKPVVKYRKPTGTIDKLMATSNQREILVKDDTVCTIQAVYTDGTKGPAERGFRQILPPGKGELSDKTLKKVIVEDSCGNKTTVNVK